MLDAAAEVVRTRGATATLDEIARHAGMSKGGVVYHFVSKDALLHALAADVLQGFRDAVHAQLDPDDQLPGRLVRAYIRASTDVSGSEHEDRETVLLVGQLMTIPAIADVAAADARRWEEELRADGLPEEVRDLVTAAADGAGMSAVWGVSPDGERLERLRRRLLAMTRSD